MSNVSTQAWPELLEAAPGAAQGAVRLPFSSGPPDKQYVEPNYRPQIDSGVHPHLITFSAPHSVQARALALEVLDRVTARAMTLSKPGADTGWLDRGQQELDRLSALYAYLVTTSSRFRRPPRGLIAQAVTRPHRHGCAAYRPYARSADPS
jgi:hypothetical protein